MNDIGRRYTAWELALQEQANGAKQSRLNLLMQNPSSGMSRAYLNESRRSLLEGFVLHRTTPKGISADKDGNEKKEELDEGSPPTKRQKM